MLHDVEFFHVYVELDGLTTLCFANRVGLILFVWPLRGVIIRVLID